MVEMSNQYIYMDVGIHRESYKGDAIIWDLSNSMSYSVSQGSHQNSASWLEWLLWQQKKANIRYSINSNKMQRDLVWVSDQNIYG